MKTDNIKNANSYFDLGENFQRGFEFLLNNDMEKLENGKYEIEGDNLYVSIQDYKTKSINEGQFEAHKKYADIQYIIKGKEQLGYTNVMLLEPITEYDKIADITFFDTNSENSFIKAQEGDFVIFMPEDAHMPCIAIDKPEYVKKAVVKVKLS